MSLIANAILRALTAYGGSMARRFSSGNPRCAACNACSADKTTSCCDVPLCWSCIAKWQRLPHCPCRDR